MSTTLTAPNSVLYLPEDTVTALLRAFVITVITNVTFQVVRAQANRVPEPDVPDFCVITPLRRPRLSTNVSSYYDPLAATPPVLNAFGLRNVMQPTQIDYQLDVHGPSSADNAQIIATLFRDIYAFEFFRNNAAAVSPSPGVIPEIQPLYADDPRQMYYENDSGQVEDRWIVEVSLQGNAVVTVPQDFAAQLDVAAMVSFP